MALTQDKIDALVAKYQGITNEQMSGMDQLIGLYLQNFPSDNALPAEELINKVDTWRSKKYVDNE